MVTIVQGAKSSCREICSAPGISFRSYLFIYHFAMTFRTLSKTKRWILKCLLKTLPFMPWVQYLEQYLKETVNRCLENSLTPHLGKTECMLLGCPKFNGPFQEIRCGSASIKRVYSKSCLGLKIDSGLKWNIHTPDLVNSFTQKLNLLKSF